MCYMSYIEHYTLVKQASAFDVFNKLQRAATQATGLMYSQWSKHRISAVATNAYVQ